MKAVLNKNVRRATATILLVLFAALIFSGCFTVEIKPTELDPVKFVYAMDGDTIVVSNRDGVDYTVRLIGIDAPESVAPESYTEKTGKENSRYGKMAADYLTHILEDHNYLYLEYDQELKDPYDRMLAYVYLSDRTNILDSVNYKMIIDGYAVSMEVEPNVKYCKELKKAEDDAKAAVSGLWQYGDFMSGK